eukprot:g653.t1
MADESKVEVPAGAEFDGLRALLASKPSASTGAGLLLAASQEHLLSNWTAGEDEDKKAALLAQAEALNGQYPGGLKAYVERARALLESSAKGLNPFEGFVPAVPAGERLVVDSEAFHAMEAKGMGEMAGACFVLVAGGLGERLGYNGIKVELPSEITTELCYLGLYCAHILALQARCRAAPGGQADLELPLCIMTSGDTHAKTVDLIERNGRFGMSESQLTIVKQEKVPALVDNAARFATDGDDPFSISTKPHGHGDVHILLHSSGTAGRWAAEGRKWIVFFQDTNGVVFRAVPAAVGVSAEHGFEVNSMTVPRKPGEAVGGICKLDNAAAGKSLTINVEYNQLDPLLRASVSPDGDVADAATGFSPYPGNINVLVFGAAQYAATLEKTGGSIPEFVNPKYADAEKTLFTKPTRLECMMQDYPKLLDATAKVGFVQLERWVSFSAVKNNVVDAAKKQAKTGIAESASSGEADIYALNRRVLASFGVQVAETPEGAAGSTTYAGIATKTGAHVVLHPSFGTTVKELEGRFPKPAEVKISDGSTLVVEGDVTIESLDLDGALTIRAPPGAKGVVRNLTVKNAGWAFEASGDDVEEKYRIRGYTLAKAGGASIDLPGNWVIDNSGGGAGEAKAE